MSSFARGCIKGGVLRARLSYIEKRGGAAALRKVLALMQPQHAVAMSGLILSASWYPFEVNEDIDRAIGEVLGGGRAALRRMGAESANESLATAHRNLIRARAPHGLLRHSAQIHNLYYDSGTRTYEQLGETSARLITVDCQSFSEEDCQTNQGWHEAAIALCGGVRAHVTEPQCRARGDQCCEYVCSWK